jgi:hypothetical protein
LLWEADRDWCHEYYLDLMVTMVKKAPIVEALLLMPRVRMGDAPMMKAAVTKPVMVIPMIEAQIH